MQNNSYDTLSQATNALRDRGFKLDFNQNGKTLSCLQIDDLQLKPADFEIVEFHRFEGASNPADMSVVYAIASKDGHKGQLIDAYGAYAGEYSKEMLAKLDIRR